MVILSKEDKACVLERLHKEVVLLLLFSFLVLWVFFCLFGFFKVNSVKPL